MGSVEEVSEEPFSLLFVMIVVVMIVVMIIMPPVRWRIPLPRHRAPLCSGRGRRGRSLDDLIEFSLLEPDPPALRAVVDGDREPLPHRQVTVTDRTLHTQSYRLRGESDKESRMMTDISTGRTAVAAMTGAERRSTVSMSLRPDEEASVP